MRLLLLLTLFIAACGGSTTAAAPAQPQTAAAPPCTIPGGHAHAVATRGVGDEAWLQVTFHSSCDLSVRVADVSLGLRIDRPVDAIRARIRSESGLLAPVVVYDAAVDGPLAAPFYRTRSSVAPNSLDQLRTAICGGQAIFEVAFTGGAILEAPVQPSNTGKC